MQKYKLQTDELLGVFQIAARDKNLLSELLKDILTPAELKEIVLRWQIVKELHRNTPQREIAEKLGVGIATVTRGSSELKNNQGGFAQILKKLS